jgi:hypothetical protein
MWPILSNIEDKVYIKMKSRADDKSVKDNSKLNCWIKVISGAKTATDGNGLIMQSNEAWGNFGDKDALPTNTIGNYYGGPMTGGDLGVNVNGALVGSGTGRKLVPRPIIMGITVKEGKDNISRECTLSMKCFSLEQMEKMQTYFLEPGYSLYIEYGWNTSDSVDSSLKTVGQTQAYIVDGACSYGLRYELLHKFRVASNGEWDSFLGFITGGSVTSDGEFFNIEVKLRGQPALPTFMQNQQKVHKLDDKTKKVDEPHPVHYYKTNELVQNGANVAAQRRFKNMYNDLPSQRQTESIRNLINKVNKSDFINFDKIVTEGITTYSGVNAGFLTSLARGVADYFSLGEGNELDATSKTTNQSASIEKSKLFSTNRYIKFDLAVDILNNNNKVVSYNMGTKNEVSFHIDINSSVIGAFKYMFSIDPKKLVIPGLIPDFSVYFLNADNITQYTNGNLESSGIFTPIDANVDGVRFVQGTDLNDIAQGIYEKEFCWGYLKDLYVNFDMFVEKLSQPNKLIGEVLLDILNEMAAAANGFWNFQIVEKTSPTSGKTVLTVIDEHFVGIPPTGSPKTFDHNGADSIFLEASLDISIPGEMANKIIMDRLDYTVNPHSPSVKANYPGKPAIFNSQTDIFLETVKAYGAPPPPPPGGGPPAPTPPQPRTKAVIEAEKADAKRIRNANGYQRPPFGVREEAEDWSNGADHARYVRLLLELRQLELTEKADAKKYLNKNIEKIDIVPKAVINSFNGDLTDALITNRNQFIQLFSIFCLIDVPFFDMLKQEAFANKVGGTGLSQPLPIKYSFKTLGISGLRRGDMFNIDGIPSKYKQRGLFQITELEQTVSDNRWYTNVTGEYRQII